MHLSDHNHEFESHIEASEIVGEIPYCRPEMLQSTLILLIWVFTARCTICAVLILHVVCPSVHPSIRLSVCDVGGSGSHKVGTNCMDN